jgi:signal transduction histidine kinase
VRIHPDDLIVVQAADRACIEGRTERTVSEYRLRMPDGNWRWMRSDAVGEDRDAEGRAWRLIGVQTDINDQRMVEELKSQFVSTVSHELRTPLTSINGSVGLLLNTMAGELPARARRMLTIAQKNCDRLILLVNDILDMEKIASGQARFKFVLADISTLVRKSVVANQPFAAKFDVTLAIMRTAPFSKALVDDSRFQQVMANLLSNAAKFSPRGGMVEVAIDLEGDLVKVSVTDHGAGIPPDFHGQIFKPFSQADSSSNRSTEGTGLGLNIASQIIERMGGGIGFDSQPGIRTTFWVTLPLADAATFAPAMPGAAPVGPDELVRRSKILHVEDDQDFAEVLAGAFGTTADLKNAEGESTARRMIAEEQYDLVILDWELQDGDGSALIADIQREQPGTPIIALTAKEREMEDPRVVATLIKSRATIPDIVALCLKSAGVAGS